MARGPLRISRVGQPRTVKHLGPGTLDFALRSVRGGRRRVMEELAPLAMEFEPRLKRAVVRWAQLTPWQRRFVTLDDLAAHAGLTQGELLGAIARAAFEYTDSLADLIVASALPDIVVAATRRARTLNGFEDRWMLMQYVSSWPRRGQKAKAPSEGKTFDDVINAGPTDDTPSAA